VLGKNVSIRSKLPKVTLISQADLLQYSVEALNLIIESKSLPTEVNNLTIELHSPVEAKEELAILFDNYDL